MKEREKTGEWGGGEGRGEDNSFTLRTKRSGNHPGERKNARQRGYVGWCGGGGGLGVSGRGRR